MRPEKVQALSQGQYISYTEKDIHTLQEFAMLLPIGITLAITIVLFVIYHKLTADNRSLEKVKRFSDRLKADLGDFVTERSEELKHYGIDLDVQQKAAKIALEKLQQAQAAVTEKAETVGTIAARFKEYDEVLAKLMEMTSRVDANLARIREDEVFAESVNRKLELAKKGLAAVEQELPLLRESFQQDADRTMASFRDSIMGELQEGLAATNAELESVRQESMEAFTKAQSAKALVEAEFSGALEQARLRAADVQDAAFDSLTGDFERKLSALSDSVAARLAELGKDTADRVGELRQAIGQFRSDWEKEAKELLADMTSTLGEAEDIFARKATEIAGVLDEAGQKAESVRKELADTAEAAKAGIDGTAAEIRTMESSMQAVMEEARTRIEDDFAQFGQELEDRRIRFEADFMSELESLRKGLAALQASSGPAGAEREPGAGQGAQKA
jgi:rubrerythrin/Asp-tRNA(Asn)/Glu-tRNA(Gln) amidotransferase C subunit